MLARRISHKLDEDAKKIKRRSTVGDTPRSSKTFGIVPELDALDDVVLEPFPLARISAPTSARASKIRHAHVDETPVFVRTSTQKRAADEREAHDNNNKYVPEGGEVANFSREVHDFSGMLEEAAGRRLSARGLPWAHQPISPAAAPF